MQDKLLEYVYRYVDVDCISDLCDGFHGMNITKAIKNCNENDYSLPAWNYCYQYLSGTENTFSSINGAKQAILQWAEKYS